MIQTQLLKLDPPYQIIAAGGMVGIQLATLIVTEDKTEKDGTYAIDTHSHPVVSYSQKHGLENVVNLSNIRVRLAPEGAVWNKVEVSDIRVLGLAGRCNKSITMDEFITLVPTDTRYKTFERVWDDNSIMKMFTMCAGIVKVGLDFQEDTRVLKRDNDGNVIVTLELDAPGKSMPLVRVKMGDQDGFMKSAFNLCLFENKGEADTSHCLKRIVRVVNMLHDIFMKQEKIKFYYKRTGNEKKLLESVVENLTKYANEEYR